MKKYFICFLMAIAVLVCTFSCGQETLPSSSEVSSIPQISRANEEIETLIGKQLVNSSEDDTLYGRLCRCLYPYLLLQSGKGYTLFNDNLFEVNDYRELVDYVILQEHSNQAAKIETTSSGQSIYYFEKEQYKEWYYSYAADVHTETPDFACEVIDGVECIPVAEMGWGNLRTFTIQSIECNGDQYTVGIHATITESDVDENLTIKVRLLQDGFQYISVTLH